MLATVATKTHLLSPIGVLEPSEDVTVTVGADMKYVTVTGSFSLVTGTNGVVVTTTVAGSVNVQYRSYMDTAAVYGARNVMGKGLFVAWIVVSLIWLWVALIIANFLPLIDGGASQIYKVVKDILENRTGEKEDSGLSTPSEHVETVSETVVEK
ncbi:hypothetical protein K505DRAFT_363791 [Melanomma pulvis-pyrius CBS 109.77]|uniref:Uncharacterized protein n=1 Tax=Melanomma pulvis-pyrius CBS 109.77 TaxID=1314802 RepID=A0A6A6X5A0_9PLEO|nr:hypothetical protein K505DRAFT_363791 [Melanomma pulvis-pyrius CBS 109.77]